MNQAHDNFVRCEKLNQMINLTYGGGLFFNFVAIFRNQLEINRSLCDVFRNFLDEVC